MLWWTTALFNRQPKNVRFGSNKIQKMNTRKKSKSKRMPPKKYEESSSSSDENDLYVVEAILKKRTFRNKIQYFVKWKGYPKSENSWEPIENLDCDELLAAFENKSGNGSKKKNTSKKQASAEVKKGAEKHEAGASQVIGGENGENEDASVEVEPQLDNDTVDNHPESVDKEEDQQSTTGGGEIEDTIDNKTAEAIEESDVAVEGHADKSVGPPQEPFDETAEEIAESVKDCADQEEGGGEIEDTAVNRFVQSVEEDQSQEIGGEVEQDADKSDESEPQQIDQAAGHHVESVKGDDDVGGELGENADNNSSIANGDENEKLDEEITDKSAETQSVEVPAEELAESIETAGHLSEVSGENVGNQSDEPMEDDEQREKTDEEIVEIFNKSAESFEGDDEHSGGSDEQQAEKTAESSPIKHTDTATESIERGVSHGQDEDSGEIEESAGDDTTVEPIDDDSKQFEKTGGEVVQDEADEPVEGEPIDVVSDKFAESVDGVPRQSDHGPEVEHTARNQSVEPESMECAEKENVNVIEEAMDKVHLDKQDDEFVFVDAEPEQTVDESMYGSPSTPTVKKRSASIANLTPQKVDENNNAVEMVDSRQSSVCPSMPELTPSVTNAAAAVVTSPPPKKKTCKVTPRTSSRADGLLKCGDNPEIKRIHGLQGDGGEFKYKITWVNNRTEMVPSAWMQENRPKELIKWYESEVEFVTEEQKKENQAGGKWKKYKDM